jgi:hypothetical protein
MITLCGLCCPLSVWISSAFRRHAPSHSVGRVLFRNARLLQRFRGSCQVHRQCRQLAFFHFRAQRYVSRNKCNHGNLSLYPTHS